MASILDLLNSQLDEGTVNSIGKQIGADPQSTQNALSTALPLLLSALAQNASQPEGAQSLQQALVRDHDGSILNNVPEYVRAPGAANGAGILRHTLGNKRPVVEQAVAARTGLDAGSIGPLLEIVAPLVMGALGMTQRQGGLDAGSLSALLGGQQQEVQESQPDLMGMIGGLLGGSGGQGDMLGGLLGGQADEDEPGQESGGGLGGILGDLLGGKR